MLRRLTIVFNKMRNPNRSYLMNGPFSLMTPRSRVILLVNNALTLCKQQSQCYLTYRRDAHGMHYSLS